MLDRYFAADEGGTTGQQGETGTTPSTVAEAAYRVGELLGSLKMYDEAEKNYRDAIEMDPTRAEIHKSLGYVLEQLERFDEAEGEYRKAIGLKKPGYTDAHDNLGVLLMNSGRYPAAQEVLREATKVNPEDATAHLNLAVVLFICFNNTEAESEAREAIRLDPNEPKAHGLLRELTGRES